MTELFLIVAVVVLDVCCLVIAAHVAGIAKENDSLRAAQEDLERKLIYRFSGLNNQIGNQKGEHTKKLKHLSSRIDALEKVRKDVAEDEAAGYGDRRVR